MQSQTIYPTQEMYFDADKIRRIHKNILRIMERLGGEVVNSSYILLDGVVREAYGYYRFPKIGAVFTSLSYSGDLRCIFHVNFLGFEKQRNKFNKVKNYLEESLRRNGLNRVNKNEN